MIQIPVKLSSNPSNSYTVNVDGFLLSQPEKWIPQAMLSKKMVIITDNHVLGIYGKKLLRNLDDFDSMIISFDQGEKSKSYETKKYIEDKMFQSYCDRDTLILALGGGVVGDIAGFVASTYMRGISYIQIPTTLLAMVDSSIGGKTGINTEYGKNLIGSFWQPMNVVTDLDCLSTLPDKQVINGLIEALKIFMTNDINQFKYTFDNIDKAINCDEETIRSIIVRAVTLKADIIGRDEKESNHRMILNMGHTIGHAIEKSTNYTILHGYAVALGILVEAKISQLLGLLSNDDYQTICILMTRLGIDRGQLRHININEIIASTQNDKKVKDRNVRYVLLSAIGNILTDNNNIAHAVDDKIVKQALLDVTEV